MEEKEINIYGQVQGVGFRFSTLKKAQQLKINGWVKNKFDGGVKIIAQGFKENMKDFIDWCYQGPFTAKVDKVEVKNIKIKEKFNKFRIKR